MGDRQLQILAVSAGGLAIAAILLVRINSVRIPVIDPVIRLVEADPQGSENLRQSGGLVSYRLPAGGESEDWRVELYDATGRMRLIMPAEDGKLWIPLAGQPLPDPRLRLYRNERFVRDVKLTAPPSAPAAPLVPDLRPPIRVTYRPGPETPREDVLEVSPTGDIPADEEWSVNLNSTNLERRTVIRFNLLPGAKSVSRAVMNARGIKAVSAEIVRIRLEQVVESRTVDGLELTPSPKGPVVYARRATVLVPPSETRGAVNALIVPIQQTPPPTVSPSDQPAAHIALTGIASAASVTGEENGIRLISPTPEDLGLRCLYLGVQKIRSYHAPTSPVRYGPFKALVRYRITRSTVVGRSRAVVAVSPGPALRVVSEVPAMPSRILLR